MKNKYGIENGQVYVAASGARGGHLVTDASDPDYVQVCPFSGDTWGEATEICGFKLAKVRYDLVAEMPAWGPSN